MTFIVDIADIFYKCRLKFINTLSSHKFDLYLHNTRYKGQTFRGVFTTVESIYVGEKNEKVVLSRSKTNVVKVYQTFSDFLLG